MHVPQTNETPSGEGIEIKFTGQLSVIYLCIISIATMPFLLSEQLAPRAGRQQSEQDPKVIA